MQKSKILEEFSLDSTNLSEIMHHFWHLPGQFYGYDKNSTGPKNSFLSPEEEIRLVKEALESGDPNYEIRYLVKKLREKIKESPKEAQHTAHNHEDSSHKTTNSSSFLSPEEEIALIKAALESGDPNYEIKYFIKKCLALRQQAKNVALDQQPEIIGGDKLRNRLMVTTLRSMGSMSAHILNKGIQMIPYFPQHIAGAPIYKAAEQISRRFFFP